MRSSSWIMSLNACFEGTYHCWYNRSWGMLHDLIESATMHVKETRTDKNQLTNKSTLDGFTGRQCVRYWYWNFNRCSSEQQPLKYVGKTEFWNGNERIISLVRLYTICDITDIYETMRKHFRPFSIKRISTQPHLTGTRFEYKGPFRNPIMLFYAIVQ